MKSRVKNGIAKLWIAALATIVVLVACESSPVSPTPTLFVFPTWPLPEDPKVGAVVTPAFPVVAKPEKTPAIGVTFAAGQPNPIGTEAAWAVDCELDAEFMDDITVPDYTVIEPGAAFTKTWRIKNTSSCSWRGGFSLTFVAGDLMSEITQVLVQSTEEGEAVDISVSMVAPVDPGTYRSMWRMRAPNGELFGVSAFAIITVPGAGAAAGPVPSLPSDRPIISGVTSKSRQIFLAGQAMGNRANVFSRVGDSITHTGTFLDDIGLGRAVWHQYGGLEPAANYFSTEIARTGNSFHSYSLASYAGWTVNDLLNPGKADPLCSGSAPLDCEYFHVKPAVAIIMIGTNDATGYTPLDAYQADLNRVVEKSIEKGVIPVLTTIPWTSYNDVGLYNDIIITTARTHDTPLIDYWAAMEKAPHHGVSEDDVHPSIPPDGNCANFSAENLKYGYTIRNLVTMQMLDALWRQVLY
ncbi:MAG: hypothetical protein JXB30_15645 [Anaerolineae bacterium]|nr:hypothetical protein [Anaerolineae bacterium]